MPTHRQLIGRPILIALILTIVVSQVSSLEASTPPEFEPQYNPTLRISKASSAIDVDGHLTEPAWRSAAQADNFAERNPGDMTEPEVQTVAWITYDKDNLYVAFLCFDDPATIRATMCQRDQFHGDDAVCLLIDTYGNASWAYELLVNPYGIQKDYLWSKVGEEDPGFDLVWTSAARITDSGYQVEMAIPFASMRFPDKDTQNWRVDFWRNRPRDQSFQYSWAAYDRNEQCWVCQWGTAEGLHGVQPGRGLELLPAFVSNQSGGLANRYDPDSHFKNEDIMGEFSLGGKYGLSSDFMLEAAYNPDFSQIEADAAQVDVNSTIALYYPERRPFFQEGADIFRTLFNSFYTRTVNDPRFAVKLTGRTEKTRLGILSAADENSPYMIPLDQSSILLNTGKSYMNVVRTAQSVGGESMLGMIVTDRRWEGGGSGTIVALDGDVRLSRNYRIDGQYLLSHTGELDRPELTQRYNGTTFDDGQHTIAFDGESYFGHAMITRLVRSGRYLNFVLNYNEISPSYRTQSGYDPINNHRTASFMSNYTFHPNGGIFSRITPGMYVLRRWDFIDGFQKLENNMLFLNGMIRYAQTRLELSYRNNAEMYHGTPFENLWSAGIDMNSRFTSQFGAGFSVRYGRGFSRFLRDVGYGREIYFSSYLDLKPIDRLTIDPNFNFIRSRQVDTDDELFHQAIFRTRIQFQVNRELSLRLVFQYNNMQYLYRDHTGQISEGVSETWAVDPLVTYRLSSFSVFYLGSTADYQNLIAQPNDPSKWRLTSRQVFMKIQYLFQT